MYRNGFRPGKPANLVERGHNRVEAQVLNIQRREYGYSTPPTIIALSAPLALARSHKDPAPAATGKRLPAHRRLAIQPDDHFWRLPGGKQQQRAETNVITADIRFRRVSFCI